jgi:putative ABC transport system substrate-binding protein
MTAGALLGTTFARAQKPAKMAVLGILSHNPLPPADEAARIPFLLRLRELGWVEGQNLVVERAYADGQLERLPRLAAALVAKQVDVIWAGAPAAAVAAAQATRTIPVVFANVTFPVELGLVDSLSRPGRNVTGVGFLAGGFEQAAKPLEFLRQVAPGAVRLASIWTPAVMRTVKGDEITIGYAPFEAAVAALGYDLSIHEVFRAADYETAFAAIVRSRAQAVLALTTPLNWTERKRIVEFAERSRLASAFDTKQYAALGGLLSYGPDVVENARHSAEYIDRILRGAQPAELPVALPRKHELWINRKTAGVLGLTVPQSILVRADRVIE